MMKNLDDKLDHVIQTSYDHSSRYA